MNRKNDWRIYLYQDDIHTISIIANKQNKFCRANYCVMIFFYILYFIIPLYPCFYDDEYVQRYTTSQMDKSAKLHLVK